MKFGKRLAVLAVSSVTLSAMSANAQMAWGTGMAMGQQACPYNVSAGDGASSYLDEYNEVKKAKSEEEAKLREMKRKLRELERKLDKNRDTIEDTIDGRYTSDVIAHMDNTRTCQDYDYGDIAPTKSKVRVDDDGQDLPPAEGGGQSSTVRLTGFSTGSWKRFCQPGRGMVSTEICTTSGYAASSRGRYSPNDCKKAITSYRKDTVDFQKTQTDIERSEERVANYKEQLPELMRDAKARYKEDRQAGTEGDICLTCIAGGSGYRSEGSSPNWAGVAANIGTGLAAMYMGYQQNKMVARYNSELGWPTQSYPTWGYGLPFIANGLYGALGGGVGGGAFGCAGGMGGAGFGNGSMGGMGPFGMGGGLYGNVGMNGPFGYPGGMMGNPYGGGMYNGGMGPWGMGGFGGMNGMGGMGGIPVMGGFAVSGGIAVNGMGGFPMGGYAGGMGGFPMGGYAAGMGGIPMGGYAGGMGGFPMGGYAGMGGIPVMGGFAVSGGIAVNGMGGYPMTGMAGMGMGYPGMGMGMDMMSGGLGSMQMQQAMMQMQQQQMQLYMQQYQQQMQNQMARQQTMAGLQSELYSLMYKIQQVQYGVGGYGTSIGVGGGISIGGGLGSSNPYVPIPASGTNTGTSSGGSVVTPASSR